MSCSAFCRYGKKCGTKFNGQSDALQSTNGEPAYDEPDGWKHTTKPNAESASEEPPLCPSSVASATGTDNGLQAFSQEPTSARTVTCQC